MDQDKIKDSFHTLSPSEEQKQRILAGVYYKKTKQQILGGTIMKKLNLKLTAAAVASLALVGGFAMSQQTPATPSVPTGSPMVGVTEETPNNMVALETVKETLTSVEVQNHRATETFITLSNTEEFMKLAKGLSAATAAEMSDSVYESIASSQSQGNSYSLYLTLSEGEAATVRIMTDLNLVYVNDAYHTIDASVSTWLLGQLENAGISAQQNLPAAQ